MTQPGREPTVTYPVREVLARLERELGELRADVHAIQLALASSAAAEVVEKADAAATWARLAVGAAVASPLVSGFIAWLITRH